jgi:hypothetical protein
MKRTLVVTAAALLVCAAGFAQQQESKVQAGGTFTYNLSAGATPQQTAFISKSVKNSPYSAKQVHERTQTLSDGTHITTKTTTTMYRDSSGRTRTEVNDEMATINDPVAGAAYRLNMKAQTSTTIRVMPTSVGVMFDGPTREDQVVTDELKAKLVDALPRVTTNSITTENGALTVTAGVGGGRGGMIEVGPNGYVRPNNDEYQRESLGTQTMEGLIVEGTRITLTIPEGAIGNDRPIKTVIEQWYSPELQLYVMTKNTDPRNGESITRLTEVSRSEPDSSLFLVPANYRVLNGVGPIGTGRGGGRGNLD